MAKNIFRLREAAPTTERLVTEGAYNYANPNVTSKNFPLRAKFMGEREIVLLEFDHNVSSEEVIAEAKKLGGLKRPVYEDALRFGVEHPGVQREGTVVFLHKPWRDPSCGLFVLCLWGDAGYQERDLNLLDLEWYSFYRFAFVRKSSK